MTHRRRLLPTHWTMLLLAVPLLLGGCATIFTGTTDTLTFDSNVPGVRLTIDGRYHGELPLTLEMSRSFVGGQQFIATFEKAGYATQEFRLARQFNAVAILDVSSTLVSGGVDVLTGALMKFSPRAYHVHMLEQGPQPAPAAFWRSVDLWGFGLANFQSIQKDVARGGGEHLSTYAALVAGHDEQDAARVRRRAVERAGLLLAARTGHDFVGGFDRLLAEDPLLRRHRFAGARVD